MAKYILKAFFLTTFPLNQKKCPNIYAVTLVSPQCIWQFAHMDKNEKKYICKIYPNEKYLREKYI